MTITASDENLSGPAAETVEALLREIAELRAELGQVCARLAEVESLADQDALTPACNRRALMRELERARAFVERYAAPASLVYFDVDNLKAINDRFGHAAGDAALKAVAGRLKGHVRASDVVGRMGGDEFAVILVQTRAAQARKKARALAEAVADEPIDCGESTLRLRVSWGVAEIRADTDAEAVVAAADAAMYAAKRAGRADATR